MLESPSRKVLFVEASIGGVLGGSLTGIVELINKLDPERFAAVLALYEAKPALNGYLTPACAVRVLPELPVPYTDGNRGRLGRGVLRARELVDVVLPRTRALQRLFARERPALVYLANGVTANLDAILAAAWMGIPVLSHEKGFRRIGPPERLASRWVDVLVGMTEELTEFYRGRRLLARRFCTIYDGIDRSTLVPGGGVGIRQEFGIPADAPVVGIVGHIQEWKGQMLVADAVARARTRHPALHCLVVGGVHRFGVDYAEKLRERIAQPDLAGHVTLAGARTDVAACFDAMDVAIHSSIRREPFGRVMIEAMSLGRPLIAPAEGGPRFIVADGETGLLVLPRNPEALADAIVTLLDDPERRRRMGIAALARVDRLFSIERHVQTFQALFDEILRDSRSRAPSDAAASRP